MTKSVASALYKLDIHPNFQWVLDDPKYLEAMHFQALYYPSIAYPNNENPIAVMGITHGFGVGEAWLITGKEFKGREAYNVLSLQKVMCGMACKLYDLNRLELKIDPKQKYARRWPQIAGFEFDVHYKNGGIFGQDLELWVYNQKEKI